MPSLARDPSRILVVDDDPVSRGALAELLGAAGYQVRTANDGACALQSLQSFSPDLVISDLSMPHVGGFGLVQCIREGNPAGAQVPIILISSHADTSSRVHGFEFGADDFVPKPVQFDELLARIERHLSRSSVQREVTRLSVSDELTGMLNRRGIHNFFARAREECAARAQPISLLLADVTKFKSINDTHGHGVGDLALCAVAHALQDGVRASDRVGRIGGDEFLIVLPGADREVCSRLEARLYDRLPIQLSLSGADSLAITFAVGSATSQSDEGLEALAARADQAMYASKRASVAQSLDGE